MKHQRHVGWLTGDTYCRSCGRGNDWPCALANRRERAVAWFSALAPADIELHEWPFAIRQRVTHCRRRGHSMAGDEDDGDGYCLDCGAPWKLTDRVRL